MKKKNKCFLETQQIYEQLRWRFELMTYLIYHAFLKLSTLEFMLPLSQCTILVCNQCN